MKLKNCTVDEIVMERFAYEPGMSTYATFGLFAQGRRVGFTTLTGVLDDEGVEKAFVALKEALEQAGLPVLGEAETAHVTEEPRSIIKAF